MKTIQIHPAGREFTFHAAKAGDVFHIFLHGCKYGDLRNKPPRVRLLEDGAPGVLTRCELLDEWPDAPEYWPPSAAPKAKEVAA